MAAAFGIHLGNSTACLAVYKDGNTEVIANEAGDRTTPSCIAFTDHDKVVGLPAKQGMIRNAQNTVRHLVRAIGQPFDSDVVRSEVNKSRCKIVEKNNQLCYQVEYKEKQQVFTSIQCASFIFETLRELAQHHGDGEVHDAVLTVPCNCNEQQQIALKESAEKAGFKVIRLVNDSSASMLAYDIGQRDHHQARNCVVIRIGGTSSSITCYNIQNGLYKILHTVDSTEVGGDMFTEVLADHFAKEFLRQHKCDPKENKRSWYKLLSAAETCKHTLSRLTSAQCTVDSLHEGIDFSCNIARARMDMLSSNLLSKLQELMESTLAQCNLVQESVQNVVLSGGATQLSCVTKKIQDYFSNAEFCSSIPADEVMAVGAAKQAGIILSNGDNSDTSPQADITCLAQSICVQAENCETEQVFSEAHPVPAKTKRTFTSQHQNFRMMVWQGGSDTENINVIAKLMLKDVEQGAEVEAHFYIDEEGTLQITCLEQKTGAKTDVKVHVKKPDS